MTNEEKEIALNKCQEILLEFIKKCYQYNRRYDWLNDDDDKERKNELRNIIMTYTTYRNLHGFKSIIYYAKDIKEVNTAEFISNKKIKIVTKKNGSTVSACEFYMIKKKQTWVIDTFRKLTGINSYHTVFTK